jgi:hypothetical protein
VLEPVVALAVVGAAHAGFQATVSVVVYPALAAVGPERFAAAHDAHSGRIIALVAPLYAALLAVGIWAVLADPQPLVLAAVAAHGVALLITAAFAAPTHGRLGKDGPTPALLRRLSRADWTRTAAALAGLALSLLALG